MCVYEVKSSTIISESIVISGLIRSGACSGSLCRHCRSECTVVSAFVGDRLL